jgi:phage terminase large subunit
MYALFRHLIAEYGLGAYFRENKSEFTFTCLNGSQIILQGLDDVEKIKSIFGITDIWVEEASEITEDDYKQLNLRMRGGDHPKRMLFSFNPISRLHWLKEHFFDQARSNVRVTHTTHKDNRFLDTDYRQELEALKDIDPYFYAVYCLGEWGELGNLVFSNYVIESFRYEWDDYDEQTVGVDFGYNDPSAIILLGWKDDELYVHDELYARGLTNTELIDAARNIVIDGDTIMTADSAEPDRISEFQQAGFNMMPAKKGKDSVRHGIDFLKRVKIHIHSERCPSTAREIQEYKWKEDKDGNVLDEPIGYNDHAIAAIRYGIEQRRLARDLEVAWL